MKKYFPPKPAAIPFTKAGFDELKTKLTTLTRKREEVIVRLQTAREMGDLSENAAYKAARFELGGIDRELRRVNYLLKVGVVEYLKPQNGLIGFGSLVTVKNAATEMTFMLVSGHESNPSEQKLSTDSPLGKSLLGKKAGDTITVSAPGGDTTYTIVKVE